MKEILLTQNKTALVDDEDFEYLNRWRWYADKGYKTFYAYRFEYPFGNGERRKIYMHKCILNSTNNIKTDHKDGNGLNNQKLNLRLATHSQNISNSRLHSNNTSGYIGVYYSKTEDKFRGEVRLNGKRLLTKRFNLPQEAALSRDKLAIKLQGEFANLNFYKEK